MTTDACLERAKSLHRAGRWDEAEALYRAVLDDDPANVKAHNNLGTLLEDAGRPAAALESYRSALALAPDLAVVAYNLAHALQRLDRTDEAAEAYRRALALEPGMIGALRNLSHLLYGAGRMEEAAEALRRWLEAAPGDEIARHALAAATGQDVPPRAADGYVVDLFDHFAEGYDARMSRLGYRAPALLAAALARLRGAAAGNCAILDAGCGTGLLAEQLRPFARNLVGVDLSARMVEKARARGLYDELAVGELTGFLAAHPRAFDIVASADTLIYFGDLGPVLRAAAAALRPAGLLLFTLECLDGGGESFRLNPNGRYAHAAAYLELALGEAGLETVAMETDTLRLEAGRDVRGHVVTARRRPAGSGG